MNYTGEDEYITVLGSVILLELYTKRQLECWSHQPVVVP